MEQIHTRMTPAARHAISRAIAESRSTSNARVTVNHVMLAIAETNDNHAARVLAKLGITPDKIKTTIPAQSVPTPSRQKSRLSETMNAAMWRAAGTANEFRHENIGLQHILLGIATMTSGPGVRDLFLTLGTTPIRVRGMLREAITEDDVQLGDPGASIIHRPAGAPVILDPVVADDPVPA